MVQSSNINAVLKTGVLRKSILDQFKVELQNNVSDFIRQSITEPVSPKISGLISFFLPTIIIPYLCTNNCYGLEIRPRLPSIA